MRGWCKDGCLCNIQLSSSELSPIPSILESLQDLGLGLWHCRFSLGNYSLHLKARVNPGLPCCGQDRVPS